MKVYMSVDLEGITGVAGSFQILQDPGALPEVRELVTGDINAAIAGAKEAGASEILVNENHSGRDVLVETLDPIAEVIIGKPKPHMTLEGIDESFNCVFMIGIHAMAGTTGGILDHTWMPKAVQALRVNGVTLGELGLNALGAGHFGIPIALVTGDTQVGEEARNLLGDVECVAVKVGLDRYCARCPHPSIAREKIRQGAARAVREVNRFKPYTHSGPMKMEIDYANTAFASAACWIPTAVREGPQTVSFVVPDFYAGMKTFFVAAQFPWMMEDQMF